VTVQAVHGFRENAATVLGRRVVAALAARDFDALAELFDADYVEAIQRPGEAPVPRAEMLRGIQMLVEGAGGTLTIEPIATLGERFQLHHTRISVPTPGGEPHVIDYTSVMEATPNDQLLRTEAFDLPQTGDAIVRLFERYAASVHDGGEETPSTLAFLFASMEAPVDEILVLDAEAILVRCTDPTSGRRHLELVMDPAGPITQDERFDPEDDEAAFARLDALRSAR
jgi:hypothetical protein